MMSKSQSVLDNELSSNKLQSYQKQLLSLELLLKTSLKEGYLSKKEFRQRATKLQQVQSKVAYLGTSLIKQLEAEKNGNIELGLPDINTYSRDEFDICNHFLSKRLQLLRGLNLHLGKLFGWVLEASAGKYAILGFSKIFRLSKIKKMILGIDNELRVHEKSEKMVLEKSYNNNYTPASQSNSATNPTDIDTLMKMFMRLERLSARIADLNTSLKKEEKQIEGLKKLLQRKKFYRNEALTIDPLSKRNPDTDFSIVTKLDIDPHYQNNSRIDIIKKFANSHLKERSKPMPFSR